MHLAWLHPKVQQYSQESGSTPLGSVLLFLASFSSCFFQCGGKLSHQQLQLHSAGIPNLFPKSSKKIQGNVVLMAKSWALWEAKVMFNLIYTTWAGSDEGKCTKKIGIYMKEMDTYPWKIKSIHAQDQYGWFKHAADTKSSQAMPSQPPGPIQ